MNASIFGTNTVHFFSCVVCNALQSHTESLNPYARNTHINRKCSQCIWECPRKHTHTRPIHRNIGALLRGDLGECQARARLPTMTLRWRPFIRKLRTHATLRHSVCEAPPQPHQYTYIHSRFASHRKYPRFRMYMRRV